MKIYQIIKIGEHHVNFCEDYALVEEIGDDKLIAAVMDGCSMGKESHFAATLIGKILQKAAKEMSYRLFLEKQNWSVKTVLKEVFRKAFQELQFLQNHLQLETEELLSTIVLLVLDKKNWEGEILAIGDGLVAYNGQFIEFEQDNKPDYLGYHLAENFEEWFPQQKQRLSLQSIEDISISTDGIFTFSPFNTENYMDLKTDLTHFLLSDKSNLENPKLFTKKLSIIEEKWGLRPTDDLGIIRLIK